MSAERPFLKKNFAGIVDETLASLRSGVGGRVILDDATEGSVLRTLVEAFSRELAVCYEQLEAVYLAGYLDTASGAALERVVELLGVARHQAGWLEGDVIFARQTPAPFDIDIPAGTLVAGKGVQAFETMAPAVLREGQSSTRVPVRSLVPEGAPVEPGKLSILKRPIAGIESATNPGVLLPRRDPESDDDLRTRARNAIRGGRTATISAIERAVLALGIVEVSVSEDVERAGLVKVVIGDLDLSEAELDQALAAIEEVRPVGVRVDALRARPVWIRVRATLLLEEELDAQAGSALRSAIEATIGSYFAGLATKETVRWTKIRNLIASHAGIAEVTAPTRPGPLANSPGIPTWPLGAVDPETGVELEETEDGAPRRLGSEAAPVGVFVGADERARLFAIELELQPPELAVWVDVEAKLAIGYTPSADFTQEKADLQAALSKVLPSEALVNPVSITWDQLRNRLADALAAKAANFDLASLRLVILHDRDGRVVTVADDVEASEEAIFTTRERIEIRTISLFTA
ncbi:MAG TPA: baseplate J/gp47 family protein [Enhygromyxa sp.]|nr:baseplate J/gp47 family protein [Enhygromyxa sp.]